jgi:myo-inositol-1(or 4)-monophosphatase
LPAPDPATDLALLIEATEAAGRIALSYWRQAPKAWEKAAEAGPVSEADLAVDAALAAGLRAARPDYGWLSEETPDDPARLSRDRVFILDPIDGTRAFLAGEETFSVSLAVATAGLVTAAVVHLPARGETYAAHLDGEARLNGRILHCQPATGGRRRRCPDHPRQSGARGLARRGARSAPQLPRLAGVPAVPGGRGAARRDADAARRLGMGHRGRALIAARAGCVVTDRHGAALRFNRPMPQAAGR